MYDSAKLKRVAKKYHLDLIILFGSQAKGRARADSDIDVAVRAMKPGWVGTRRVRDWNWKLGVIGEVAMCFDGETDISFLTNPAPLFAYQIIAHGKLLYERKAGDYATFYSHALRRYFDHEKFFRMTRNYLERNYGEKRRPNSHRGKTKQHKKIHA